LNIHYNHTNNVPTNSDDDIRNATLTSGIDPTTLQEDNGWKNITSTTKKSVNIKYATISPAKRPQRKYNKRSPNFNPYDPEGSIVRRSIRIQNNLSQESTNKDQPSCRSRRSTQGGQKK
jgi:hypothetical protein